MLKVLVTVKTVFQAYVVEPDSLPSESSVDECPHDISQLYLFSGSRRAEIFRSVGVTDNNILVFFRAFQHLTSLQGRSTLPIWHRLLFPYRHSNTFSSRFISQDPLEGFPFVLIEENYEKGRVSIKSSHIQAEGSLSLRKERDTTLSSHSDEKQHYPGLFNQGATCYLNSLLQMLYHLSVFRIIIYNIPNSEPNSIPRALQCLFCRLQTSLSSVSTTELTASFGWNVNESFVQHDIHEMTRKLLDNLEEKIKISAPPVETINNPDGDGINPTKEFGSHSNPINSLFVGHVENYIQVSEADYYSSHAEPFYDLQLVVKGHRNIYESFDSLIDPEVLDGANKYCLSRDNEKVYYRALRGVSLRDTPPVLFLHLTRFDFDAVTGDMAKIFSRWEYYAELDLSSYMPTSNPEECKYELYSVLVHSGTTARCGHYHCYVQCDNYWYKFNDEIVTRASLYEVFGSNFGGNKVTFYGSSVPLTSTAYMLVYIQTSRRDKLLFSVSKDSIPNSIWEEVSERQRCLEQQRRDEAENHMYARFFIIFEREAWEHHLVTGTQQHNFRFLNENNSIRIPLKEEVYPYLSEYIENKYIIPKDKEEFWYSILSDDQKIEWCPVATSIKAKDIFIDTPIGRPKHCLLLVITYHSSHWISIPSSHFTDLKIFSNDAKEFIEGQESAFPENTTVLKSPPQFLEMISSSEHSEIESEMYSSSIIEFDKNMFEDEKQEFQSTILSFELSDKDLSTSCENYLTHHFFYDPMRLDIYFIGLIVISTDNPRTNIMCDKIQNQILELIRDRLPEDKEKELAIECLKGIYCSKDSMVHESEDHSSLSGESIELTPKGIFTDSRYSSSRSTIRSELAFNKGLRHENPVRTTLCVSQERGRLNSAEVTFLEQNTIFIWQETPKPKSLHNCYPTIKEFKMTLDHQLSVEFRLLYPPSFPLLCSRELFFDMTYEQLQGFVARKLGLDTKYDYIRFARHDNRTGVSLSPRPQKCAGYTLRTLLFDPTNESMQYQRILYCEICPYPVTEIETMNSLKFFFYDNHVRAVSTHWVLFPLTPDLSIRDLLRLCIKEVEPSRMMEVYQFMTQFEDKVENDERNARLPAVDLLGNPVFPYLSFDKHRFRTIKATITTPESVGPTGEDLDNIDSFPFEKTSNTCEGDDKNNAPQSNQLSTEFPLMEDLVRLLFIWKGRIWKVLNPQDDHLFTNIKEIFYEGIRRRLEFMPKPLSNYPLESQLLIDFQHLCKRRNRITGELIYEFYGDPFSMYLVPDELWHNLQYRISWKLNLKLENIIDWKPILSQRDEIRFLETNMPVIDQVIMLKQTSFSNEKDLESNPSVFFGLLHAPIIANVAYKDHQNDLKIYT